MDLDNVYPVYNIDFEEKDGLVILHHVDTNPTFFEKYIVKKTKERKVKIDLDEIGSFVWKQFNGTNSLSEICRISEESLGDKIQPVEERVQKFVSELNKNGFIKLYEKR